MTEISTDVEEIVLHVSDSESEIWMIHTTTGEPYRSSLNCKCRHACEHYEGITGIAECRSESLWDSAMWQKIEKGESMCYTWSSCWEWTRKT